MTTPTVQSPSAATKARATSVELRQYVEELESAREQQHRRLAAEYDQTRYWPRIAALRERCAANGHVLTAELQESTPSGGSSCCRLCGTQV
jgi:hypothetical protein